MQSALHITATFGLCFCTWSTVATAGGASTLDPAPSAADTQPADLWTRTAGEDWPSFLGPTHNGKSTETGIVTKWTEAGLPIVWQRASGTGYAAGVTSRGRYFHFERVGDAAQLVCLNAEHGNELWKFAYPTTFSDMYRYDNGPRSSPVVDGDRVYTYGAEGMLSCLRVDDGKLLWQCDTMQRFGVVPNFFGVGSTPAVEQDLLIVIVGGSPPEDQDLPAGEIDRVRGNGTGIVAFDKFTGDVKYSLTNELASYASPVVATIRDRRRCLAFCRGGLVAFFPDTGEVNFRLHYPAISLDNVHASTPVIVGNDVFISEAYGPGSCMLSVEPGGFQIRWRDSPASRSKIMQTQFNTAIYHDGFLYGCSGRYPRNMELRCVDWKTGTVVWKEPTHTRSSLLYADQHLISLEERGRMRLIRATPSRFELDGEFTLRNPDATVSEATESQPMPADGPPSPATDSGSPPPLLQFPCWATPILSHGLLYVRSANRLVCFELIPAAK
jgi:outer membrane protein assembly factor BamB